jgi:hypothetical protein
MSQHTSNNFWYKLGGYYLIPHELLHVLAYRLIGKPYHYKWGDYQVRSLVSKTRGETLFVLLFPFAVCWTLSFFFGLLWLSSAFFIKIPPERYLVDGPTWHFIFPILAALLLIYSGSSHWDLVAVYYILWGKEEADHNSPKPHQQAKQN